MGIQDRDWYRDWHREKARAAARPFASVNGKRLGIPPWILWIVLVFAVLIAAKFTLNLRKSAVPFPPTGQVHWYVDKQAAPTARLSIEAPNTPNSQFVVKLDQWETKLPIVMIPISNGETAVVQVPLGLYRVTIVKGSLWGGPDKLFSVMSEAKEAIQPLSFHRTGDTTVGHIIKLESLAGNMETRPSRLGY